MTQGYGAKFQRSADSTTGADGTWTQIAGVISIEPPAISRGSVDTTLMDGTTGYKTAEPSLLRDGGSVSVVLAWNRTDTGQTTLASDLAGDDNEWYGFLYPDGSYERFFGHITSWGKSVEIEDRIQRTVEIKISGAPVEGVPA